MPGHWHYPALMSVLPVLRLCDEQPWSDDPLESLLAQARKPTLPQPIYYSHVSGMRTAVTGRCV